MPSPENPCTDAKDRLWEHIDQVAVVRLRQLDHRILLSHQVLRQQLEELSALLTRDGGALAERSLNRIQLMLEHGAHLARESIALIDERHQLLRW